MRQRRVGGDARAEQRRGRLVRDGLGDPQDEVLVHHDVGGVAALGDRAVAVDGRVRPDVALQAVLLLPRQAVHALPAGVDHAAHPDPITDRVLADLGADLGDLADDLVADGEGVGDLTPLAAHGVDVGVADAGVADRDQDVRRGPTSRRSMVVGTSGSVADGAA